METKFIFSVLKRSPYLSEGQVQKDQERFWWLKYKGKLWPHVVIVFGSETFVDQ